MSSWAWQEGYQGVLSKDQSLSSEIHLLGFHWQGLTKTTESYSGRGSGTYFGFVSHGAFLLTHPQIGCWTVRQGQWFSLPQSVSLSRDPSARDCRMVLIYVDGYQGVFAMGGPIEEKGRLRYIDGCSDSLLFCPPKLGDPCLNHLHFPQRICQTMHYHPSARMGIVASGSGEYVTKDQRINLSTGTIFYIPKGVYHHFETFGNTMDVFAFHPDSDWGPMDEVHPMINRTWVDGKKIAQPESNGLML